MQARHPEETSSNMTVHYLSPRGRQVLHLVPTSSLEEEVANLESDGCNILGWHPDFGFEGNATRAREEAADLKARWAKWCTVRGL